VSNGLHKVLDGIAVLVVVASCTLLAIGLASNLYARWRRGPARETDWPDEHEVW
jgi:hypothetical protein